MMSDGQPERAHAAIAECRLDLAGLREQRERYRALAADVAAVDRRSDELVVRFEPGFDRDLLERTLAIERECCPFFRLELHAAKRQLVVTVEHEEQRPALAAIGDALSA